jgi:hypothetical protein
MGFQLVKLTDPAVSITTNINPMGAYSAGTTYAVGDVVTYNGLSYLARQSTTGNTPTNTTYWQLVYDDTQKFTVARNSTGATIYKGTIVYLSGATGSHPNIVKSRANAESTSARTFGVAYEDIANNSTGNVLAQGLVEGLDTRSAATNPFTSDTLAAGDVLYLDPDTAGYVTNTKPVAPDHIVYVGFVVETSPTDGKIIYRIQNGYELDEIHDVLITAPSDNQVLTYESSSGLWKNEDPTGGGGGTTRTIVVTSGNTTAGSTAGTDYIYLVAGAHTITMPTAVSNTNRYSIKNNYSANITINTTSSQTIDGTTSISIAPEESIDLISDNSNWRII